MKRAIALFAAVGLGAGPARPVALAILATRSTCAAASNGGALVLPDGTRVPSDDEKTTTTAERIDAPDVEDVFVLGYPHGPIAAAASSTSIVDASEAEGFVWGGRWFHYDTMHFEWRPEVFDSRTATRSVDGSDGSREAH